MPDNVDDMLEKMNISSIMTLTDSEIETLRDIDAMKQGYILQSTALSDIAYRISLAEQAFFFKLYKRLNLDKKVSYSANWRTGEVYRRRDND